MNKSLRERLADPHCYAKPLFPRSIEDMSQVEREEEATECTHALLINVWQTTTQFEEVQTRQKALHAVLKQAEQGANSSPDLTLLNTELTHSAGFNLLRK